VGSTPTGGTLAKRSGQLSDAVAHVLREPDVTGGQAIYTSVESRSRRARQSGSFGMCVGRSTVIVVHATVPPGVSEGLRAAVRPLRARESAGRCGYRYDPAGPGVDIHGGAAQEADQGQPRLGGQVDGQRRGGRDGREYGDACHDCLLDELE
jgi:hypothetical protein